MKYLIDNNLPPALAHAIRELSTVRDNTEVYALKDKFPPATKDIDWITALSEDNDWVVISQDQRFLQETYVTY